MKKILYICCLCFLISCQDKIDTSSRSVEIDLNKTDDISIFEIFSHINLIPLETTPESLIARMRKIILHNGIIYVLDDKQGLYFYSMTKVNIFQK